MVLHGVEYRRGGGGRREGGMEGEREGEGGREGGREGGSEKCMENEIERKDGGSEDKGERGRIKGWMEGKHKWLSYNELKRMNSREGN